MKIFTRPPKAVLYLANRHVQISIGYMGSFFKELKMQKARALEVSTSSEMRKRKRLEHSRSAPHQK